MFPLTGTGAALYFDNPALLWVPIFGLYILMPILDALIGPDKNGILIRAESQAKQTRLYKFMVHMLLPIIIAIWAFGAWYAVSHDLPLHAWIAVSVSHGWSLAFGINAGHETGHKTDKFSKWIALLMLAPSFLGHFRIEHNQGHHSKVATPEDPATARYGESFWAFIPREYFGGWKRAWHIEARRARLKGHSKFSLKNEMILATTLGVTLWAIMIAVFSVSVIPYLVIAATISCTALSAQNFIGHYGLLREKRPDGKYKPCEPCHSWNCNQIVTNLTTYNLALHSDHHAHPRRHYQELRPFPDAPQLPYGYMTMYWLAYIPPLFRRVMHPKLLSYVDGDMSRVLTAPTR